VPATEVRVEGMAERDIEETDTPAPAQSLLNSFTTLSPCEILSTVGATAMTQSMQLPRALASVFVQIQVRSAQVLRADTAGAHVD